MKKKALLLVALLWVCAMVFTGVAAYAWNVSAAPTSKAADLVNAKIQMNAMDVTLKKGGTVSVKTSVTPKVSGKYVRFSSSDTSVARVTQAGKVKGVAYGDAVISAEYGDAVATCKVVVTGPLSKVALNASSVNVKVGDNYQLSISSIEPHNASVNISSATWGSSKSSVATVSSSGTVTAVGEGTATISVKLNGKVAKCTLKVAKGSQTPTGGSGNSGPVQQNVPGQGGGTSSPPASNDTPQQPSQPAQSASSGQAQSADPRKTAVLQLVNEERAKAGLKPVKYYQPLERVADIRAEEINRQFGHTRPDGSKCFTVIDFSFKAAGENIATGFTSPAKLMAAWMNSPSHRDNILSGKYNELGIGFYEKDGVYHWVQMFASR